MIVQHFGVSAAGFISVLTGMALVGLLVCSAKRLIDRSTQTPERYEPPHASDALRPLLSTLLTPNVAQRVLPHSVLVPVRIARRGPPAPWLDEHSPRAGESHRLPVEFARAQSARAVASLVSPVVSSADVYPDPGSRS